MNRTHIFLSISIFLSGSFLIAGDLNSSDRLTAEDAADQLIRRFDTDRSSALNQLELSEAIVFLQEKRPLQKVNRPATSAKRTVPNPPKVAVSMLRTYDTDSDAQLTDRELTMAITSERSARIAMRRAKREFNQG